MRKCRFCGKEIADASRVCEHCGRDLIPKIEPPPEPPPALTSRDWLPREDSLPPIAAVRVVDIEMKFSSMVWFMIQWTLAAIPALIILGLIGLVFGAFVSLIFR